MKLDLHPEDSPGLRAWAFLYVSIGSFSNTAIVVAFLKAEKLLLIFLSLLQSR